MTLNQMQSTNKEQVPAERVLNSSGVPIQDNNASCNSETYWTGIMHGIAVGAGLSLVGLVLHERKRKN